MLSKCFVSVGFALAFATALTTLATAAATEQPINDEAAVDTEQPDTGIITDLTTEELELAEKVLRKTVLELNAGDGPHYTLSKINEVEQKHVEGILFTYYANLIDTKENDKYCKIEILYWPALSVNDKVTFECDGEVKVVLMPEEN